jgi:uncharacterized repeat protein (TIGR01451 family)
MTPSWWLRAFSRSFRSTPPAPRPRKRPQPYRPRVLALEDRLVPAQFTVSSLNDSGAGTLRQAILDANADTDALSTVSFSSSLTGAIDLTSALPHFTHNIEIDGPGAKVITVQRDSIAGPFNIFNVDTGVSATVIGLTITNGSATATSQDSGGGILNLGNLTLEDAVVSGNTAANVGGGIASPSFPPVSQPTLTIVNCAIINNTISNGQGAAGIDIENGTATISNSTISGNTATNSHSAGGIGVYGGRVTIDHSTISNNTMNDPSGQSAGGLDAFAQSVTLFDTIIAGNSSTATDQDVAGSVTSNGHNLIGNVGNATGLRDGVNGDQVGGAAGPINPMLGLLQDNGGATPTMALQSGSPAIDTGSNTNAPLTDQRGFERILNGTIDIGAYESSSVFLVSTITVTLATANPVAGGPLAFVINVAPAVVGAASSLPSGEPVLVRVDGGPSSGATLTNGIATFNLPNGLSTGTHQVSATYDGDSTFTGSTGSTGNFTVNLAVTGTPVTAVATDPVSGQPAPFSGQVASFTTGDSSNDPADFTVSIDWGDGTSLDTTSGSVVFFGSPVQFVVNGIHTYANAGNPTIAVTITDLATHTNGSAQAAATVVPFSDSVSLAVTQTGPSRATVGDDLTYTLTMTNSGPADAQDVTLTDVVPDGTTFLSAAQLSGPAFTLITPQVGGTGIIVADPVALPAGQSAVFKVMFHSGVTASIINRVTVTTATANRNNGIGRPPPPVPVQLTLSSSALADNSPPGTAVGSLTITLPNVVVGQFLPPIFALPASEASDAAFALVAGAAGEALATRFLACSGARASYQVSVHVDVGFGDQVVTLPVTVTPAVIPCTSATAPPVLETVQVVRGGKQGQVQELVLHFGGALDPASATALGHYTVRLGFTGKGKKRKPITVSVVAAAYDPVHGTVTLRLGKVKGAKLLGTLVLEDLLGLNGVPGNATLSVDLRPKPAHKH